MFSVMIAGNPDLEQYSMKKKVEPYVKLKYKEAKKFKKDMEDFLKSLKKAAKDENEKKAYSEMLDELKEETEDDLFYSFTSGCEYDPENGDAMTTENPKGKWMEMSDAKKNTAVSLVKNNGDFSYCAKKSEIDWKETMENPSAKKIFEDTWELIVNGKKPENDIEKQISKNRDILKRVCKDYKDKEHYVIENSYFFCNAFVSEKEGWVEYEEDNVESLYDWETKFYDRFIKDLPEDTDIKIVNYTKHESSTQVASYK